MRIVILCVAWEDTIIKKRKRKKSLFCLLPRENKIFFFFFTTEFQSLFHSSSVTFFIFVFGLTKVIKILPNFILTHTHKMKEKSFMVKILL